MDWWQDLELCPEELSYEEDEEDAQSRSRVRITCVPAQHNSGEFFLSRLARFGGRRTDSSALARRSNGNRFGSDVVEWMGGGASRYFATFQAGRRVNRQGHEEGSIVLCWVGFSALLSLLEDED